jgi:long-chain fatty acid transport protein
MKIKTLYLMKKLLSLTILAFLSNSIFAGGLVTNTNQSASWARMPSQNASTGASAAYYNPAGLMRLKNGFHFSISNQIISQTRNVENFYTGPDGNSGLNNSKFEGKVFAPVFPGIYAVYKHDKFALSFGFNPIGGGGSAKYDKGLPSFEMKPSDLVYSLNPTASTTGVTGYRLNSSFDGSSVFFGYQGGISFNVSENVSLYAGLRYVTAKNTYKGYIRDIEVYNYGNTGGWTRADDILSGIAGSATTAAANLSAAIIGGLLVGTNPASASVLAGLQQLGVTTTAGMTNNQAVAAYNKAATKFGNNAILLHDQEADVTETGHGITPVFGINIAPSEKLDISIKLEGAAYIELLRKTKQDVTIGFLTPGDSIRDTMFPNGRKFHSDLPAMLSFGVNYQLLSKLLVSVSANIFFDRAEKLAYGKQLMREYVKNYNVIDKSSYEISGGLEYKLSDKLLISGGYLMSKNRVNSMYQSDMGFALSSNTFCLGGAYNISDKMQLNLGFGYSMYDEDYKYIKYELSPTNIIYPKETYNKSNMFLGIGLDISF